jgi:hypothetical protein
LCLTVRYILHIVVVVLANSSENICCMCRGSGGHI